jgi:hypothetical protein
MSTDLEKELALYESGKIDELASMMTDVDESAFQIPTTAAASAAAATRKNVGASKPLGELPRGSGVNARQGSFVNPSVRKTVNTISTNKGIRGTPLRSSISATSASASASAAAAPTTPSMTATAGAAAAPAAQSGSATTAKPAVRKGAQPIITEEWLQQKTPSGLSVAELAGPMNIPNADAVTYNISRKAAATAAADEERISRTVNVREMLDSGSQLLDKVRDLLHSDRPIPPEGLNGLEEPPMAPVPVPLEKLAELHEVEEKWIELDNEVKGLRSVIRELQLKKKELEDYLKAEMQRYQMFHLNSPAGEKIILKSMNRKGMYKKDYIFSKLQEILKNPELAADLSDHLENGRPVSESVNLCRTKK